VEPATVTCSSACTITLVVSPAGATPEMYDAANVVFAGLLAALCIVWGAKRVYRLFSKPTDA
jgi:hypothetical protein